MFGRTPVIQTLKPGSSVKRRNHSANSRLLDDKQYCLPFRRVMLAHGKPGDEVPGIARKVRSSPPSDRGIGSSKARCQTAQS